LRKILTFHAIAILRYIPILVAASLGSGGHFRP
jgi:hypothetical protein